MVEYPVFPEVKLLPPCVTLLLPDENPVFPVVNPVFPEVYAPVLPRFPVEYPDDGENETVRDWADTECGGK